MVRPVAEVRLLTRNRQADARSGAGEGPASLGAQAQVVSPRPRSNADADSMVNVPQTRSDVGAVARGHVEDAAAARQHQGPLARHG